MTGLSQSFVEAGKNGDIAQLENLLALGADVNAMHNRDCAMTWAANNGHVKTVTWLLDHGADINIIVQDGKWTPLMVAAVMGKADVVQLLLERGADAAVVNTDGWNAAQSARNREQPAIAQIIQAFMDAGPDEVSFTHSLQDRLMQEIFNFPRKERVTLVRKSTGGDVEAMQRDSFSSLDDLSGLRRAFAEHKKRGGKMDEAEVFSGSLQKTKLNAGFKP